LSIIRTNKRQREYAGKRILSFRLLEVVLGLDSISLHFSNRPIATNNPVIMVLGRRNLAVIDDAKFKNNKNRAISAMPDDIRRRYEASILLLEIKELKSDLSVYL
jgi:hypothetical protein